MNNKKGGKLWWSIWLFLGMLVIASLLLPTNKPQTTEQPAEFVSITKQTPSPIPATPQKEDISPIPSESPAPAETLVPVETIVPTETPSPIQTPTPTEDSVFEEMPVTVCSVSVQCQTALAPDSGLDQSIRDILPQNGVIFQAQNIQYQEGETAFDVLSRELRNHNIHFEFNQNPMFNSVYIEGIHNLYEFDCGSQSGWLYFVNGKSPGEGCSQYVIQPGDYIEFVYTCSFGSDIF